MMRQMCGIALLSILLACSPPAWAEHAGQVLTREQVEAVLQQHVLERGPWRADQVELTARAFSPLSLPDGAVDVQVLKPTDGVAPGQRRFLLAIAVNGEEIERRWVQAELRVFDDVIVAARSLAYHETITIDDIRIGRRELNTFSLRALTDPQEAVGRHAVRTIAMNEVLTPAMVSLPQVVQRGNRVSLVFESAGLRVEIAGRAMQAGKIGERIRVENTSSGKIIEGQILDTHTVKVN
jgi:flagellar basal body P-ring formation protein FlgA